jgi:arginase
MAEAQDGTRIRNGHSIREYSLKLADRVHQVLASGDFPLVIGGDCSILLGCLLGARRHGSLGLIHLDGHTDFFHPGNYDSTQRLGSVAGMDLALATGRGEELLTRWPDVEGVLAEDEDVIQVGERDTGSPDFVGYFADIQSTRMTRITMQELFAAGVDATGRRLLDHLQERQLSNVWLHVDLDILDQTYLPAVDSPGSPGLGYEDLSQMVGGILASGRVAGMNITIYDPGLDPGLRCAPKIVEALGSSLARLVRS